MFKWQICYTEVTDFLQFTLNVQKSHEQHSIFALGLQSALRLAVGFSNVYCEL
jgi:hypothetical protein